MFVQNERTLSGESPYPASIVKFEVPQRQQLASERTSLTLFAPAPSTISFVPLTRNLSPADPSPAPSTAFGTGNGPLRYGINTRCSKRPPVVRDAFSEAFGAQNRLLRYGRDIRCQKQPPPVRDASSKARRTADSTDCGQPPATLDAFQRRAVPKAAPAHRTHLQCAKRPPLSLFAPAAPSLAPSTALGTRNGLLRYGIRIRCSKRLPMVRDASSEAFGVKNRLFWYGRDTRYRKRPSGVPNASSEAFGVKNRLLRYGKDIRCQKQPPLVRDASSKVR